jgi:alkaline phosphatase D
VLRFTAVLAMSAALAQEPALTHGPCRGHVDADSIHVWARAAGPGAFTLELIDVAGDAARTAHATAVAAHDFVLHFALDGLPAGAGFGVRIRAGDAVVHDSQRPWSTGMPDAAPAATIAFGSCADERRFPEQPIWDRIAARAPHALVLLGDAPYIDDGTVEGRRRRHREFFAFPPVHAVLRAIPTWATWDDHDYATNDVFGAVAGSATARPVFVDYHAHADYGDGARGIYTRFRSGPIEVFLLDTRSFADTEPSVLAPGERSLLGRTQTEWLQAALRASTAPIKVLACGMVWNDGVRRGKVDHWGNWRPERNALFRWLGTQEIGGVVLVSGDVHRSRVIVHPTQDVVGYDLPEFVTSPLGQNVLEANAVPAPGLAFDAGEASSCLFLEAALGERGCALRVVFLAGDGREFHVRELAPGALMRPNAAATYRQIVAALRARFGPDITLPEVEYTDEPLGMSAGEAVRADWRQAVAAVEPEFAAWHGVAGERRCRFAPTASEPMLTEFLQELFLGVQRLRSLNAAAALQALADRQVGRLVRAAGNTLALARHLQQEPGAMAWAVAAGSEREALAMLALAAPLGDDAVAQVRALVAAHVAQRPGVAAAGVAARLESERLFEASLARLQMGKDAQAEVARQFGADVRRAFLAHVLPIFDAFDGLPDEPDAARLAELDRRIAELVARRRERKEPLEALRRDGKPGADAAADLGLLLATMLVPSLPQLHQEQADVLERLRAAVR